MVGGGITVITELYQVHCRGGKLSPSSFLGSVADLIVKLTKDRLQEEKQTSYVWRPHQKNETQQSDQSRELLRLLDKETLTLCMIGETVG